MTIVTWNIYLVYISVNSRMCFMYRRIKRVNHRHLVSDTSPKNKKNPPKHSNPSFNWVACVFCCSHRSGEGGDAEDGDPGLHAPSDRGDAGGPAEPGETLWGGRHQPAHTHAHTHTHTLASPPMHGTWTPLTRPPQNIVSRLPSQSDLKVTLRVAGVLPLTDRLKKSSCSKVFKSVSQFPF